MYLIVFFPTWFRLQIYGELLFETVPNKPDIFWLKTTVMRCCIEEFA